MNFVNPISNRGLDNSMPYSSVSDLPKYVRQQLKSRKKQRQWLHIWNGVYEKTKNESEAFQRANGVLGLTRSKGDTEMPKEFYTVKDNEIQWFIPFEKADDEQRIVGGWATTEQMDKSNEIVDYEGSKEAFGNWIGNIREQHDPRKAIGKAVKIEFNDAKKSVWVEAYISKASDGEDTWKKVKEGVLKGYSLSGRIFERSPEIVKVNNITVAANRVKKYSLSELSLVDAPMNPGTTLEMIKSVDGKIEVSKAIETLVECPCIACQLSDQVDKSDDGAYVYMVLRKANQDVELQKELAASDGDLVVFPDGNYVTCINPHKFMYTFQPALDDVSKAQWTRKFINDLSDSAFAYIESGGKKDADDKTVPRSLRHFPHHTKGVKSGDEDGTVDLPHLRNALARVGQGSEFGEKAKAHLEKHAKALKVGEQAEKMDAKAESEKKIDEKPAAKSETVEKAQMPYNCPHCDAGNPYGAKYCNECGEEMTKRCEKCDAALPGEAKYCNQCGEAVAKADVADIKKADEKQTTDTMVKVDTAEISKMVVDAIGKEFSMEKFSTTVKDSVHGQVQKALDEKFGEVSGTLGQISERLSKIEGSPLPDTVFIRPIDKAIGAQGSNVEKSVDDIRIEQLEDLMKKTTNDGMKAMLGKELANLIYKKEKLAYQVGGKIM